MFVKRYGLSKASVNDSFSYLPGMESPTNCQMLHAQTYRCALCSPYSDSSKVENVLQSCSDGNLSCKRSIWFHYDGVI